MTNLRLQAEQKEIQINITDANVVSLLQIVIKFFFLHLLIYCFPFHLYFTMFLLLYAEC